MPEPEDLSDVAFIMCTSGTTGVPKGAMITHENMITNLLDIADYFKINSSDKILIARPLYHCAVLTGEFLISLMNGLHIVFYDGEFNPTRLIQTIRKHKITVMGATPTIFYHISNIVKRQKEKLPLKTVAVSGECMTEVVAKQIKNILPDAAIYNVYGLTEASPRVSYLPPEYFDEYPLSVGIPLKSVSVKIANGELFVKGKSVMKGYYNDKSATDKAIQNRWLHTGDIATIDENGFISIKSRKDNMIIRGGMNIYPQEIENALLQDNRIKEALAFGVYDKAIGQRIHLKVSYYSRKWEKWLKPGSSSSKTGKAIIAGHYVFSTNACKALVAKASNMLSGKNIDLNFELKRAVKSAILSDMKLLRMCQ